MTTATVAIATQLHVSFKHMVGTHGQTMILGFESSLVSFQSFPQRAKYCGGSSSDAPTFSEHETNLMFTQSGPPLRFTLLI